MAPRQMTSPSTAHQRLQAKSAISGPRQSIATAHTSPVLHSQRAWPRNLDPWPILRTLAWELNQSYGTSSHSSTRRTVDPVRQSPLIRFWLGATTEKGTGRAGRRERNAPMLSAGLGRKLSEWEAARQAPQAESAVSCDANPGSGQQLIVLSRSRPATSRCS